MLITIAQYAERHGLTASTVRTHIHRGRLPAQKIDGRWHVDSNASTLRHKVRERFFVSLDEETALAVELEAERRGLRVAPMLRLLVEEGVKRL